jgi:NAD+ kinase
LSDRNVANPASQIAAHLRTRGIEVYRASAEPTDQSIAEVPHLSEAELAKRVDLLIAVGGDGTMLHAARAVAGQGVPLLGINRGRLGFLTDISPEHMLDAIDSILSGDYLSEDRHMLEAQIIGHSGSSETMFALNDVVLQQGGTGHLLDFVTTVDGTYVNTHGGDGLIVATPTGSTAYALSCGGPIIQPNVNAIVMVPICPHTLSDRPLVLQTSSLIEVQVQDDENAPAHVSCDGQELGKVTTNDLLRVRAARETITLLHPTDYNYYELLRSKLNWGRANRNGPRQRTH